MLRLITILAAAFGALGVGIGAFGAHGLEKMLEEQMLSSEEVADRLRQCDTAIRYHMLHTLALLAIGLGRIRSSRLLATSVLFFLLGLLLFCGGLYSMVFAGVMGHWAIVPSGGLCFLLGWILLAVAAASNSLHVDGDSAEAGETAE